MKFWELTVQLLRIQGGVKVSKHRSHQVDLPQTQDLDKIIKVCHTDTRLSRECFWICRIDVLSFRSSLRRRHFLFECFLSEVEETPEKKHRALKHIEEGKGSPLERQQSFGITKNKMRCSQGVAMVFEDAFVVFSRFLSLKSRGCALLETHRQRETTGIKKLYNSFFVMF